MSRRCFGSNACLAELPGDMASGHVRYSTTGGSGLRNVQPLFADLAAGGFSIAHNGNISNAMSLKRDLVGKGAIFQSTSDTEVIIHLVATSRFPQLLDKFVDALRMVEGAYSLICMTPKRMIACRDPLGIRPLVMGRIGDATVFASETVALDVVGADFVRQIDPGELVEVRADGKMISHRPFGQRSPRPCIFEHVYFSRPNSMLDGQSVYEVRKRIGMELAKESPAEADLVVPVPDSGVPAAIGYAQQSGMPFELGIIRSHYVGRTFIQPSDGARHADVKRKHNANRALVEGKRIVLIDDSIVRGTTSMKIVQMMRDAGAAEVHLRVASPPTEHSLLLRGRYPRTLEAAGRADGYRGDGRIHPGRQPRLRLDRRALPRSGRERPQRRRPAILRRLLQRRIPDQPYRPCRTRHSRPADPAGQPRRVSAFGGQVALVTGASRGIGAATAEALAAAGAHVILTARDASALEAVEERIFAAGGAATIAPMDLAEPDAIARLAAAVAAALAGARHHGDRRRGAAAAYRGRRYRSARASARR